MKCPSCGLLNPNGASTCDCGHYFATGKAADHPQQPITLHWGQQIIAFWTLFWRSWVGGILFALLAGVVFSPAAAEDNSFVITLIGSAVCFLIQAAFSRSLVTKNYRSFRIYVIRHGELPSRQLSMIESLNIWFWIFAPQFTLLVLTSTLLSYGVRWFTPEVVRQLNSLAIWARSLLIGPLGISLAMRAKYQCFRLQAYSFRS